MKLTIRIETNLVEVLNVVSFDGRDTEHNKLADCFSALAAALGSAYFSYDEVLRAMDVSADLLEEEALATANRLASEGEDE